MPAGEYAPPTAAVVGADWLVLTSHDCDILDVSIDNEPVVEVLRMRVAAGSIVDKRLSSGRNPRTLQIAVETGDAPVILSCVAHDRWTIPRNLLAKEPPVHVFPAKQRRLVAEWLAKRYIRSAFPTAFDQRWRSKLNNWLRFLRKHSEWMQGVYLRLSTLDELAAETPYQCHLILAVPHSKRGAADWARKRTEIEEGMQAFWNQFKPDIHCAGVEVLGTDEITLADIEPYQRFDADWVSFEDDTSTIPPVVGI